MGKKRTLSTKNGTIDSEKSSREIYRVAFYRSTSGREPVREWLKQLDTASRKRVGEDLFTLQLGWPLGMPLARKIEAGLWEQRSKIVNGIVRIIFTVHKGRLVLLHGFTKKSEKLPASELKLARKRLASVGEGRKT